eukprot:TRINITY_DN2058_c0_g5_i2.p2 TRINITY_DN2058_c0_g5~~TRINITY_DN2058_c0_g5_i2.p2  ORF type:complete len:231 (+),score=46.82 TRINITY_DN2058_c0_g5_i2:2020-2712(+)
MKHNEYLEKVLKILNESESKENACTVFMEQATYLDSFRARRSAEIYKTISSPSTPPSLKPPPTLHNSTIETFRIFLILRQSLPKLLLLRVETELPVVRAMEEETMDVVGLAMGESVGVECYEDRNSVLRTRVVIEAKEGVSVLAPEYANKSGYVRITRSFSYINLQICVNEIIKTRLILKENEKNVVELIFDSELKAKTVCDTLNRNKRKYVSDTKKDILAYLDSCRLLQ